jgi:hypothetical protein
MSLKQNTPSIFLKYQDQASSNPAVEDGNSPSGELQGKIFTSDLTPDDDYSVDYSATIISADLSQATTGNLYSTEIQVGYIATFAGATATNPGFYGSELIKENDLFTIQSSSKDYVRGIVSRIVDLSANSIYGGTAYDYVYTLLCTINQGDPVTISSSDRFTWKRQVFSDKDSFNEEYSPSNLSSSYIPRSGVTGHSGDIYFYWQDINQNARNHRLMLRDADTSLNPTYYLIDVYGNSANSDTSLIPYINSLSTDISSIKIESAGIGMNSNRTLDIVGTGTGAKWATRLDVQGSLLINEFSVYEYDLGTSTIRLYADKTRSEYQGYPICNVSSYIDGLPALGSTQIFTVSNVTSITDRTFEIDLIDALTGQPIVITSIWGNSLIGKKVQSHDGVYRLGTGTGYNQKSVAQVKTLPSTVRAYIDAEIPAGLTGLTAGSTWAWSVSSTFTESQKSYSNWSDESYLSL